MLRALWTLTVNRNALTSVPAELGQLSSLQHLWVRRCVAKCLIQLTQRAQLTGNRLEWLPHALDRLPATTEIFVFGNPLAARCFANLRPELPDVFAITTFLQTIREPAFTALVGLADLDLPALLLVEILDQLCPNAIPMHKKWNLVVAVKHWQ